MTRTLRQKPGWKAGRCPGSYSPSAPPHIPLHNPTAGTSQAVDLKERSIIFHAAKSQAADVFQAVIRAFDGYRSGCPQNTGNGDQTDVPRKSWLLAHDVPEPSAPEYEKRQAVRSIHGRNVFVDYKGMTVLHVACRWGCPDIVQMILKEVSNQGADFVRDFLRIVDDLGRTPLMNALRHDHGTNARGLDSVGLVLDALVDRANNTAYPEKLRLFTLPPSPKFDSSALMHAAFGGPKRLEFVQSYICSLVQHVQHDPATHPCHGGLRLDYALGIEHKSPTKLDRYGILLAAAASGGHSCVLEDIIDAIKVRSLCSPC